MVCGAGLEYLETPETLTCSLCGKTEHGYIRCPELHYICESCHNRDSVRVIKETVLSTKNNNPFEIAELLIDHPGLPMLGCQHAYIAGGSLIAAIRNQGSRDISDEDIREVFMRTERQALGGYCGLTGVCGIAPSIGACFSVLTGSRCGTDREQRLTMEVVSRVMKAMTELTGPGCCKAYVRSSLEVAVRYLKETLGIALPSEGLAKCRHSSRHPHGCRKERCPYF